MHLDPLVVIRSEFHFCLSADLTPDRWSRLNLYLSIETDLKKELERYRPVELDFAGFDPELKPEAKVETTDASLAQLEESLFATVTSSGIPKLTAPPADGALNPPRKKTKGVCL